MRLSGKNFSVNLGDVMINVVSASLSITDNSAVDKTNGIPDGYTDGDVEASGELVVNNSNFRLISQQARSAGSWRGMKPFDITFYGKYGDDEKKIEAFGCRIKLSDLLDLDSNGGKASTYKIPFDVTDPDFIHIDGVPYLAQDETANIVR